MKPSLILSQDDVTRIVKSVGVDELMDQLIAHLTRSFVEYDPHATKIPVREGFSYSEPRPGLLEWMPLLNCGSQVLMKVVGYHPHNPEQYGLPTILSSLSIFDAVNGHLEALIDGTLPTALRTGAASAVATRLLASPDSATIGLIGCGAQAVTQLHAMTRVLDVDRVLYYDVDPTTTASFPSRCLFLGSDVQMVNSSLVPLVSQSDVLCCATSVGIGAGPVFADGDTLTHLHVNAVGSDFPGKYELPAELLGRSYVTPDCRGQAVCEGECQQLRGSQIGEDLCQLIHREELCQQLRQSVTVFDSTGWALEDYEVTKLLMAYAGELGVGSKVQVESIGADPKNPYQMIMSGGKVAVRATVAASL